MLGNLANEVIFKKAYTDAAKWEAQIEIAKNAILEGSPDQFIAKITGLSLEYIQELRKIGNKK